MWAMIIGAVIAGVAIAGCASGDDDGDATTATTGATTADTLAVTVSSPVRPGSTATASVSGAEPSATCRLTYRTPSGTESDAAGLGEATADVSGAASWTWEIGSSTNEGTGSVTVRCGDDRGSADIEIGGGGGAVGPQSSTERDLVERIEDAITKQGNALGCLWQDDGGSSTSPLEYLELGEMNGWGVESIGNLDGWYYSVMYPTVEGKLGGGDLERVEGDGWVCFRPGE